MSNILNDTSENLLKKNKEILILQEIFDMIEAKKENKETEIKNDQLLEKYNIKNIKLEKIYRIEAYPKNRYKSKLQKLLFKKKNKF